MNSDMKYSARRIAFFLPVSFLALAVLAHAQTTACPSGSSCLNNILSPTLSTVPGFLSAALTALVKISLPIITVFIVYSGFLFVMARGNAGEIQRAKMNFFYVIIGALLILGAWIFANIIGGTVTDILGS